MVAYILTTTKRQNVHDGFDFEDKKLRKLLCLRHLKGTVIYIPVKSANSVNFVTDKAVK